MSFDRAGSNGLTPKQLDAAIEAISKERGLMNQGDDGISEAPPKHGIAAHLHLPTGHSNHASTDPSTTETSEDAAWERERQRLRRPDGND